MIGAFSLLAFGVCVWIIAFWARGGFSVPKPQKIKPPYDPDSNELDTLSEKFVSGEIAWGEFLSEVDAVGKPKCMKCLQPMDRRADGDAASLSTLVCEGCLSALRARHADPVKESSRERARRLNEAADARETVEYFSHDVGADPLCDVRG